MRYLVVGTSGAGKSTFAAKLAAAVRCPCIELDVHYWGPGWQAVPAEQFRRSVIEATQGERWVADGNYSAVRDVLWSLSTYAKNQAKYSALREHSEFAHLQWTELTEPAQARALIEALAVSRGGSMRFP